MATEALVMPGSGREKRTEYKAIALVSSAHFVNHFQLWCCRRCFRC